MIKLKYVGNPEYIEELTERTGMTKKELFKDVPFDKNYVYQIFKGTRHTTVYTAWTIAYVMHEDINRLFTIMED